MAKKKYPKAFLEILQAVTNKRAKIVIEHILKNGHITTEDLEKTYGYRHPPRAARDVREAGIPLETFSIKSSEGKSIAAYRFGDVANIKSGKLGGRRTFSKVLKKALYDDGQGRCYVCNGHFELRYLQVDHRIPYEISGDEHGIQQQAKDYMLLCASCNRAKSWSCEHCENWRTAKQPQACLSCFWGMPEHYEHIALQQIRRLELVWQGKT